jgi:hypothetical protein
MPLKEYVKGHFVLRCPNFHGTEYSTPTIVKIGPEGIVFPPPKTTMDAAPGWMVVPAAGYQIHKDGVGKTQSGVGLVGGMPVRLFVCRMCGYIEMYAGPVIAPNEWPASKEPSDG